MNCRWPCLQLQTTQLGQGADFTLSLMNLLLQIRLRSIDVLVSSYGRVNRGTLMDLHGISVVQASLDLKEYLSKFPGNLVYDKTVKAYVRGPNYIRSIP